ncbi:MAG: universal stress protein [Hyphomicrobiaceae bacterium]
MIRGIAHATDFSPQGTPAFLMALRLAVEWRCPLNLLHVKSPHAPDGWQSFPHVREALIKWGLLGQHAAAEDVASTLGIRVRKVEIRHRSPVDGIAEFMGTHACDLIVLATHGRQGLSHLVAGSIADGIAQQTQTASLLVGPAARSFVDDETGALRLRSVVVPIAATPSPVMALHTLGRLFGAMPIQAHYIHVGERAMALHDGANRPLAVATVSGPVAETILRVASDKHADMLVMPTVGRHGFVDALRGSTTEQLVAAAQCPVLAVPA